MSELTVVADIGARYGIHPSWNGFDAPLHYIAFEPDIEEAARLRTAANAGRFQRYDVMEEALDKTEGIRDFHLLRHRGLSSFLKPDLASECFRHLKPGQAEIDRVVPIKTVRLDSVFERLGLVPDFLKVDTEGTEQDVIEGGERLYGAGILGVRASCNFQPCFIGQRLFSESHDYLLAHGFVLLNLDYRGFGYPRLGLFRKPDPVETEDFRYGILVAADAVWVRRSDWVYETLSAPKAALAIFKLAHFCMLNHAPDLAVDILVEGAEGDRFAEGARETRLYQTLRLRVARFLGRWRTVPDEHWDKARLLYRRVFAEELAGGSEFYPQVNAMVRALEAAS